MATTDQVRDWWHEYRCNYGTKTNMFGRSPVYAQNTSWVRALEQAHYSSGYVPTIGGYIGSRRQCPAGIGGQTCEEDGDNCSLHNYGLAWDVEYQYNRLSPHYPAQHTVGEIFIRDKDLHKYTLGMVQSIESVTNTHGERLFSWLGWIGDYMHWQINVPPERQDVDWSTIEDNEEDYVIDLLTDKTWMMMFHSGVPGVEGFGRYYCSNDGTYDWAVDPLEGLNAQWGTNPHGTAPDGMHQPGERLNAFNHLMQGFSAAAGDLTNQEGGTE